MNRDIDPNDRGTQAKGGQRDKSPNEEKEVDDNEVQRGLTGETDDEEDVGGDIAGNAAGITEIDVIVTKKNARRFHLILTRIHSGINFNYKG